MNSDSLTEEQRSLGSIYVWIHRRAEYLRRKQREEAAAAGKTLASETATTADDTQADKPEQEKV